MHFNQNNLIIIKLQHSYPNSAIKVPRAKKLRQNMIVPATKTPPMQARTLFLNPMSRILAARVPVHAPVPGRGIPTKMKERYKQSLTGFLLQFLTAFFALFSRQNEKNLPITGLVRSPDKNFSCKQINKWYRNHISNYGNQDSKPEGLCVPKYGVRDCSTSSRIGTIEINPTSTFS